MQLQFKNIHIFFATEAIWNSLNYKFKFLLNEIVTAHPEDDYVQTIEVPEDIILQIFSTVTVQPEGVSATINLEMLNSLLPQIEESSNLNEVMQKIALPNEGARILIAINEINNSNKAIKASKILKGKSQILS